MLIPLKQCRKILGDKAKDLSDEAVEAIRGEMYEAATLAFNHWRKSSCLTTGDSNGSLVVSQVLTSNQLPTGESADEK